jgi:hypothetical protein
MYHYPRLAKVKIRGVEPNGIWVESEEITNQFLRRLAVPSLEATLVVFFPFHAVNYVLSSFACESDGDLGK